MNRKQVQVLRYLKASIEIPDEKDPKKVKLIKPSIYRTCKKFGLKEETVINWLVQDKAFFKEFLQAIKVEIIGEIRPMVRAVIKEVKRTGNSSHLKVLLQFLEIWDSQQDGSNPQESWESLVDS